MSDFENALHQGYTAAEMAADEAEAIQRMGALGCGICRYRLGHYMVCATIIMGDYDKCPYHKEVQG